MSIRNTILVRVYFAFGLIVLLAFLVFGKMAKLQYVDGEHWKALADSLSIQEREVEAARGNIYSNDGSLLATSVPEYELRFDAMAIPEEDEEYFNLKVDSLAIKLADFFKDSSLESRCFIIDSTVVETNGQFSARRIVNISQDHFISHNFLCEINEAFRFYHKAQEVTSTTHLVSRSSCSNFS